MPYPRFKIHMTDHSQTQKQIIDKKEQKNPKNKKLGGGGNDSNFIKTYKIYPMI